VPPRFEGALFCFMQRVGLSSSEPLDFVAYSRCADTLACVGAAEHPIVYSVAAFSPSAISASPLHPARIPPATRRGLPKQRERE
jgi:hypothetical protein